MKNAFGPVCAITWLPTVIRTRPQTISGTTSHRQRNETLHRPVGGWIRQRGFPLLKVTAECKQGRTQVELSQERFTAGRANEPPATWQIPVVLHAGTKAERLMLGPEPTQVAFAGCVPVIANGGDTGYYRVQYNAANMARLRAAYSQLPSTERIGLVADTMALARSGRIEFAEYFRLLEAVQGEREGAVWQQVIENLGYLDEVFAGTAVQRSVRDYGRYLLQPVMRRLGWQPQSSDDAGTLRLRNAGNRHARPLRRPGSNCASPTDVR